MAGASSLSIVGRLSSYGVSIIGGFTVYIQHLRLDRYQQQERRRQRTVNRSFKMQRLSATHQTVSLLLSMYSDFT